MFPRRAFITLCVAAIFTPLGVVLAQTSVETVSSTAVDNISTTAQQATVSPTITATPVSESVSPVSSLAVPTSTAGLGYYPTIPGQSYDNPTTDDNSAAESAAGADGTSDTFINIPLGAEIAIISVVVIAGIVGLVFGFLWYQRRRRQWEIQGRRRSLVPRLSVSQHGGLRMSRPVYIRDSIAATPIIAVTPATRPSSGSTVASFDPVDLEKGNERSEFENESKVTGWKKIFSKK